jgi:tellurite resistance protein
MNQEINNVMMEVNEKFEKIKDHLEKNKIIQVARSKESLASFNGKLNNVSSKIDKMITINSDIGKKVS